jgi:hypothetical protein
MATAIHALADLFVLARGLHTDGALGFGELGLQIDDLLGIAELDDIERPINVPRNQYRYDQHVRTPLEHDFR